MSNINKLFNICKIIVFTYIFLYLGQLIGTIVLYFLIDYLQNKPFLQFISILILSFIFTIVLILIWVKFFQKRNLSRIGLDNRKLLRNYLQGFLLGVLIFSSIIFLLKLTYCITWTKNFNLSTLIVIISIIPAWIIQSASEEILFRGFLMHSIIEKSNVFWGLLISATFFSFVHLGNPNVTFTAIINIFIIGIFFGLYTLKSKNLWGAAGFHCAWNWTQGNIFGLEVSGSNMDIATLLDIETIGPNYLTGGSFGPEAGFITSLILLISTIYMYSRYKKSVF